MPPHPAAPREIPESWAGRCAQPGHGISEHAPTGISFNTLEINEIRGSGQGLLQQRLSRCTPQKHFGLQRQRGEKQRPQ